MLDRVLFAGGGTGGHIYMAVALAQKLKEERPTRRFLFVGTRKEVEAKILPDMGFQVETLRIGGLKRVDLLQIATTLMLVPGSLLASRRIIKKFSPSIIVGLGGYSAGPVLLVGKTLGLPSLLIEPNVIPGLTNRLLRRYIDGAAVAYEETLDWFGGRARLTGIPVRPLFHEIRRRAPLEGPLHVLIFGGSQGSRAINNLVCEALPLLPHHQFSLVHQTGLHDYFRVREAYEKADVQAKILDFIHDMPTYFSGADLILSRAGALTVAEITAAGKASLLIPFPHATDNHQQKNAELLESKRAALVLDERQTSPQDLARLLTEMTSSRERLTEMAQASRQLANPGSAARIIELMQQLEGHDTHQS